MDTMPTIASPKTARKQKGSGPLEAEVLVVLREEIEIHDTTLKITRELERSCYERVNEVLMRCGGKYSTRKRVHEFPYDPTILIQAVIESGQMPPKNPLDFFYSTPPVLELIKEKLTWSASQGNILYLLYRQEEYDRPFRILEPSAGIGHIAELLRTLFPRAVLHCCECDPFRRSILCAKGFDLVDEPDFLSYQPEEPYDLVVMNSPFSIGKEQDTYVKHIRHAFDLLHDAEESELLAVAPAGFTFNEKNPFDEFYTFVLTHGALEEIPNDAFKEAGTMIRTMLLWLGKKPLPSFRGLDLPYNGYPTKRVAQMWEWMYSDTDTAKRLEALYDRMVAGELVVYSDGTLAPETRTAIYRCCEETIRTARRQMIHLPLEPEDYNYFIAEIMEHFEENYNDYVENRRASIRRAHIRQLQEAESAIQCKQQALDRDKKQIIELAQANRRRKEDLLTMTADYKALQERLQGEPDWQPKVRPAPPAPSPLQLALPVG
jgi:hypothetical protein